ncbi:spore germination protein [Paenibacillus eucommiae]|uniref:Spore germination protein KA n=1 Tax=Paenibacillus eucommiae TaxID=1355755 RepID=A0ABS4J4C1_9BACL|nr:spore germination protein [Paenibacillus eucommiae]MBP1994687.1 spore germination protein KA [Paenibacillus eucommiae]
MLDHTPSHSDSPLYKDSEFDAFVSQLVNAIGNPPDLVYHTLVLRPGILGSYLFIETLVDKNKIEDNVLKFFSECRFLDDSESMTDLMETLKSRIPIASTSTVFDLGSCAQGLLKGMCLLVIPGADYVLMLDVASFHHRPVAEPKTETTVQGPHEAFNEDLITSIGLVRKRIVTSDLRFEQMMIGKSTETKVWICYIQDLAPDEILNEFRTRIRAIETDSILDSTYIEEWIQDKIFTPFPTLMKTERPDVMVSHLLEGRVAVLVDGSPYSLIGPVTFMQYFTSPEDYYQRADIATFLLWIRFLAYLLAVFVPALYVAVSLFHHSLLPPTLLVSLSAQREGVPFPSYVEAFLMMMLFELLREAGLRMPRISGQAIAIVGALVLGEAAVQAGLVSAATVIVVAVTAITNFVTPFYNFGISQRFLQYAYMILAGFTGLFGILCGVLFTVIHLASLKSFGVPYLAPIAPTFLSDWKDVIIRVPRPWMKSLPRMNNPKRKKR